MRWESVVTFKLGKKMLGYEYFLPQNLPSSFVGNYGVKISKGNLDLLCGFPMVNKGKTPWAIALHSLKETVRMV